MMNVEHMQKLINVKLSDVGRKKTLEIYCSQT